MKFISYRSFVWCFTSICILHIPTDGQKSKTKKKQENDENLTYLMFTLSAVLELMSIQVSAALCQNIPTVLFSLQKHLNEYLELVLTRKKIQTETLLVNDFRNNGRGEI